MYDELLVILLGVVERKRAEKIYLSHKNYLFIENQ